MSAFAQKIIALLFPSHAKCLACDTPRIEKGGPPLCVPCLDKMETERFSANVCDKCGHELKGGPCHFCKTGVAKPIVWMRASHPYHGVAGNIARKFKYHGITVAGTMMVTEMVHVFSVSRPPQIDICTYVPTSPKNLRLRGQDHALLLCQDFCEKTDIPFVALLKALPTHKNQANLNKKARIQNKKGAYEVIGQVKGLNILLIDDVVTTGATIRECANMLLKAGAASVNVLSYAFS